MLAQIQYNNRYDDIPAQQRVKTFSLELDPAEKEKIARQLDECRKYLNSLT
jgi:CRISPR/Cas system-associated exonuclease Cas4 (RecB family)